MVVLGNAHKWRWIGIILSGIAMLVFLLSTSVLNEPQARAAQERLESEFGLIRAYPGAVPLDCESWHKPDAALVQCVYRAAVSYEELRGYYDSELAKHGWQFDGEKPVTFGGKDYGGKTARYRLDRYYADLEHVGAKGGWDYALSLSWSLQDQRP